MKLFRERVPLALKYMIICFTTQMELSVIVLALGELADIAGLAQPTESTGEHQNTQEAEPKPQIFSVFSTMQPINFHPNTTLAVPAQTH